MRDADMSDERARAHFKAGTSLYESGRFPEAAEEWEQAFQLSQRAALLYNIYVAHRDASNLPKAIDALTRYLATNDADASQRLNLEARLRAMQTAQAATEEQKKASEANAVAAPAPEAAPPASAPPPSAAAAPEPSRSSVLPLTLVVAGGVLVAGSLVTGLLTEHQVSNIETKCPNDQCPASYDLASDKSSARTLATLTDVLWISGAVVAGVGLVLWLTGGDDASETQTASSSAHLSPSLICASTGCAGTLAGKF